MNNTKKKTQTKNNKKNKTNNNKKMKQAYDA